MATNPNSKAAASTTASRPTIQVKAAKGVRVPIEGAPRKYITDAQAVTVTRTAYYLRRIKDGDLVPASAPAAAAPAAPARAPGVASEA